MKKVKLYKEQAEELELQKKELPIHGIVTRRMLSSRNNKTFESIDLDTLIRALYIGYKVEETFKVGDWVVHSNGNIIRQIEKVERDRVNVTDGEDGYIWGISYIRHATPSEIAEEKQRRWWAKHGREVWELKENDLLYYDDEFKEVEEVSEIGSIMLSSERMYLPIKTIKNKYSVACFAEDRKDVK